MKKLWVLTELFYPDETSTSYILTKVTNRLADKYDVNVVSGSRLYQANKNSSSKDISLDSRVTVFRVSGRKLDKNNILQRVLNLIIMTVKLSYYLFVKVDFIRKS